jgi:hypothetical protein
VTRDTVLSGSYMHTFQRHPTPSVIMEAAGDSETSVAPATRGHMSLRQQKGRPIGMLIGWPDCYFVMFDTAGVCVCKQFVCVQLSFTFTCIAFCLNTCG